ncbi:type II toxin-antitoxin system RelE/ParE family toxin [Roseobacter sp. HKCCD9010]|uniref:type II toxin-antitoxin system RelE/ParE family toxin n=1 Tax=unclassified Roseobacter TaxID=196798 RepID=UPI001491641A|nr:type II toxin-antitoxin system RelE/ParE family toxin [Rhodobacterales bacterium HKCCD4356]NNV14165.1 type II toxin-antitoxin system RelE/ParE family toxin [Roseobacter sp. HKCCD7357]NNV18389.1 type II toxin-antitoxin system RelE/ParE family toxin [Roseobacter sp. HKCCD8768]NNV27829.1 type II toxin-antitoxin system RelE/ParE family toxin [Roseobacter sp. HKCCD8192]NNV32067.1 type II toxin-antitoxin system RelE/ParE family toxin [Roseobacter sp. HKCCD9061]NNV36625.1 type II toxin-antitoxin s
MRGIWHYSHKTWGTDQAERYLDQIETCCKAISDGGTRSKSHDALPDDVRVHRCEHHYIFWLTGDVPIIIAVLHERMDLLNRLRDRL